MPTHAASKPFAARSFAALLAGGLLAVGLSGCSDSRGGAPAASELRIDRKQTATAPEVPLVAGAAPAALTALHGARLRPDVLVTGAKVLTPAEIRKVVALAPGAIAFASTTVTLSGKPIRVASVDPATFRRYAAAGTAESTAVWQSVARGELVASHALAKRLHLPLGKQVRVVGRQSLLLRLGALATTGIPGTDLVVDTATGKRLGLTAPTAVLLSAGKADPATLASRARKIAGSLAEVDLLSAPAANPVAFLSGSKAAKAFGAFSYKYFADGTIQPDAAWVNSSISTQRVPIFGRVTCHRLMLPQLRGALQEVVDAGLAGSLHTYNGCYVPRFIERDPSHAISLHTWGIAIDLDSAANYRGIKGTMNPEVVKIFKRWGFRWGGDWKYSDPMHFEIGALLTSSPS